MLHRLVDRAHPIADAPGAGGKRDPTLSRGVALTFALAVAACVALLVLRQEPTQPRDGTAAPSPRPTVLQGAADDRREVAPTVAPADARPTITGTLVLAGTTRPVAGAAVRVEARPPFLQRQLPAPFRWNQPLDATTSDENGRFALRVPRAEGIRYQVEIRHGEDRLSGYVLPFATDVFDLGTIAIGGSVRFTALVQEPDGTPAAVRLNLVRDEAPAYAHRTLMQNALLLCRSDAQGQLASPEPLSPGHWRVAGDDCEVVSAPFLLVDAAGCATELPARIVVRRKAETIASGMVVNEQGEPLPGIRVDTGSAGAIAQALTAADGTFTAVQRSTRGEAIERVDLVDPAGRYAPASFRGPWPHGTRALRLVMTEGRRVTLRVLDAASRQPVFPYTAHVIAATQFVPLSINGGAPADASCSTVRCDDPSGEVVLRGLPAGEVGVAVVPPPPYALSDVVPVTTQDRLDVLLASPNVRLAVVDASGRPVAGARVTVAARLVQGSGRAEHVVPPSAVTPMLLASGWSVWVEAAAGDTDAAGRLTLALGGERYRLRVAAPEHAEVRVAEWSPLRLPETNVVRLDAGGAVRVRVRGLGSDDGAGCVLENLEQPGWTLPPRPAGELSARYPVPASGELLVPDVPAGRWRVWLYAPGLPGQQGERFVALGECTVVAGRTALIEHELASPLACTGRVVLDGSAYVGRVALTLVEPDTRRPLAGFGPFATARDGGFTATLLPGTYVATLAGDVEGAEAIDVGAGQEVLHVDVRRRRAVFALPQVPPDGARFVVVVNGRRARREPLSLEGGELRLASVPGDPFVVECEAWPGGRELAGRRWGPFTAAGQGAVCRWRKVPSKSALGESAERWMQPGSRPRLRVG